MPAIRRRLRVLLLPPAERRARRKARMPALHPERLARKLPRAQEKRLAAAAREMWPDGEHAVIAAQEWRRRDGGRC